MIAWHQIIRRLEQLAHGHETGSLCGQSDALALEWVEERVVVVVGELHEILRDACAVVLRSVPGYLGIAVIALDENGIWPVRDVCQVDFQN